MAFLLDPGWTRCVCPASPPPPPGHGDGGDRRGAERGEEVGAQERDGVERRAPRGRPDTAVEEAVDESHHLVEQRVRPRLREAWIGERGMADIAWAAVAHGVVGHD